MKSVKYIFFAFLLCLSVSCTDNISPECAEGIEMPVVFHTEPLVSVGQPVRAIGHEVEEGVVVSDFWVFQYNEKGAFIGKPRYYRNSSSVSIRKPSESGVTYTTVFIANTHDNALIDKIDYSTLSALKSSGRVVQTSSDLYEKVYDDLILNGLVHVTKETSSVDCRLYRNVAKLAVNMVNNDGSGITIKSLQLKNVNNKIFYADRLYMGDDNDGTNAVPSPFDVEFIDFEYDEVNLAPGNGTTLNYYLTRNMRGKINNQNQEDKNSMAPPYATYLEVIAVRNGEDIPMKYQFYLGKDNSTDFNIEPDYLYNITFTFNDAGVSDDRGEDISVYDFFAKDGDANSYIVNTSKANVGRRYIVQAADRINKFWESEVGKQNSRWAQCCLGEGEWVAEVIWQDIPKQVIKFYNDDGTLSDIYSGTAEETSFSFVLTSQSEGVSGNILIGVRKEESKDYIWSWHIWLTDYAPDSNVGGWVSNKYAYQVTGGHLHRYPLFETVQVNGKRIYDGKFIMDRNLGATGIEIPKPTDSPAERSALISQASGLYYMYGRKDPFPVRTLYDINGTVRNRLTVEKGPGYIYQSVTKPYNYYKTEASFSSGEDWAADNHWRQNDWNDFGVPDLRGGDGKSFFDPCPPGWRLPRAEIFDALGDEKFVYAANCNSLTDISQNEWSGYGGWVMYLAGESAWNSRNGEVTYYPASGLIKYQDGALDASESLGSMWTVLPASRKENDIVYWDRGYYLYYRNTLDDGGLLFSHPRPYHRYLGMPVRCIQE